MTKPRSPASNVDARVRVWCGGNTSGNTPDDERIARCADGNVTVPRSYAVVPVTGSDSGSGSSPLVQPPSPESHVAAVTEGGKLGVPITTAAEVTALR